MRHAAWLVPILCCVAPDAQAQTAGAPVQTLREQHVDAHREIRMQVNFTLPISAGPLDPSRLPAEQAQARRAIYQTAFRECETIVDTIAEECRLDNLTVNAQPNFNPMMMTQLTASATYRVVLKDDPASRR